MFHSVTDHTHEVVIVDGLEKDDDTTLSLLITYVLLEGVAP